MFIGPISLGNSKENDCRVSELNEHNNTIKHRIRTEVSVLPENLKKNKNKAYTTGKVSA